MATPPIGGFLPLNKQQKKEAKVEAIKQQMGGITKVAEEAAAVAAKQPKALQEAYGKQEGATKLGIQSQLAQQLAQQEGMGGGYNKAAARQQAAQAGLSTGMALGQIGVQATKDVGTAEQQAIAAKQEAAGQKYEELTGTQTIEKELDEGTKQEKANLDTEIDKAINSTKGDTNDNEEQAVANLMDKYNELQADFDAYPDKKKALGNKIAGIMKDAIQEDWNDLPKGNDLMKRVYAFLQSIGYDKEDWDAQEEIDY